MKPSDRTPPPRWQRRPDARPEEILDAAFDVFGEQGFARAKLEDIAQRAGVSKGTLYLYFDSKEAVFRAMVRAKIVTCVLQAEEMVRAHQGSARDLLVLLMQRFWDKVRDPQVLRICRLVTSELPNFPDLARFYLDEVILQGRRLFDTVIERGIRTGEFRPSMRRYGSRAISALLVQTAQTQSFFAMFDPKALSDDAMLAGAIELVLEGIATHAAAAPATT